MVPLDWVTAGLGIDNTVPLLENDDRAMQLCYRTWNDHFEFLNLGHAAYLDFFSYCKQQFPSISDQVIAKMVQGVDVDLFRPDDELQKLARLAVRLDLANALCGGGSPDEVLARVAARPQGAEWLAAWQAAQDPWFNFTSGNGMYSDDKYWCEHLDIPLGCIADYTVRVQKGEAIERPVVALAAERDRVTDEVREVLSGYCMGWAVGAKPIGAVHLKPLIAKCKGIMQALATQTPRPALNAPPAVITEPFTILLWGITSESVARWLGRSGDDSQIRGMAASPGVVEGLARVIRSADQLGEVQPGEILVAPVTAPSWAPVFGKIAATVTDIGGMMSHASIVCREYGLPAVTGTASSTIRTGQRLRVDGGTGTVEILAA